MNEESDSAQEVMTPIAIKHREDLEWFNQRLANARIHNSELERNIARYRSALNGIADIPPGSRGAYSKFVEGQKIARDVLALFPAPALNRGGSMSSWQPIATAPKDRLIDIWIAHDPDGGVRWTHCYYDTICDQWRTSHPSGRLVMVRASAVTHWMPVPTGPSDAGESK